MSFIIILTSFSPFPKWSFKSNLKFYLTIIIHSINLELFPWQQGHSTCMWIHMDDWVWEHIFCGCMCVPKVIQMCVCVCVWNCMGTYESLNEPLMSCYHTHTAIPFRSLKTLVGAPYIPNPSLRHYTLWTKGRLGLMCNSCMKL
jgi:hypothetical protein